MPNSISKPPAPPRPPKSPRRPTGTQAGTPGRVQGGTAVLESPPQSLGQSSEKDEYTDAPQDKSHRKPIAGVVKIAETLEEGARDGSHKLAQLTRQVVDTINSKDAPRESVGAQGSSIGASVGVESWKDLDPLMLSTFAASPGGESGEHPRAEGIKNLMFAGNFKFSTETLEGFETIRENVKGVSFGQLTIENIEAFSRSKDFELWSKKFAEKTDYYFVDMSVQSADGTRLQEKSVGPLQDKKELAADDSSSTKVPEGQTTQISLAAAIALKSLQEGREDLFAKIANQAPFVIQEICLLPLDGNIFTIGSILEILEAFSSSKLKDSALDPNSMHKSMLASMAIKHFYRYHSLQGLPRTISWSAEKAGVGGEKEHRLVQNPDLFLQEMIHLIWSVMRIPAENNDRVSETLSPATIRRCAWQSATIVGASIAYASDFELMYQEKTKQVAGVVDVAFDLIAACAKSGASSLPGPAEDVAGALEKNLTRSLRESTKKWLVRPHYGFDLEQLAKDISYLSKAIADHSKAGLLVCGTRELTFKAAKKSPEDLALLERKSKGQIFYEAYFYHLRGHQDLVQPKSYKEQAEQDLKEMEAEMKKEDLSSDDGEDDSSISKQRRNSF